MEGLSQPLDRYAGDGGLSPVVIQDDLLTAICAAEHDEDATWALTGERRPPFYDEAGGIGIARARRDGHSVCRASLGRGSLLLLSPIFHSETAS